MQAPLIFLVISGSSRVVSHQVEVTPCCSDFAAPEAGRRQHKSVSSEASLARICINAHLFQWGSAKESLFYRLFSYTLIFARTERCLRGIFVSLPQKKRNVHRMFFFVFFNVPLWNNFHIFLCQPGVWWSL